MSVCAQIRLRDVSRFLLSQIVDQFEPGVRSQLVVGKGMITHINEAGFGKFENVSKEGFGFFEILNIDGNMINS